MFQSLIDDLQLLLKLHKFVDDCTLTEITKKLNTVRMQRGIDNVDPWSSLNYMNISRRTAGGGGKKKAAVPRFACISQ